MGVPEDLPDKSVLVPIDISSGDFLDYEGHEELVEKLGLKGFAEAILQACELFEKNKSNFKKDDLPIPMTVAEWKDAAPEDEDEDDDDEEEDDGEEEGEEEDDEDDEAEDEAPAKKRKTA